MKIVVVGCTHAGTAAVVNLKELHPESEITIYEKNDNLSDLEKEIERSKNIESMNIMWKTYMNWIKEK